MVHSSVVLVSVRAMVGTTLVPVCEESAVLMDLIPHIIGLCLSDPNTIIDDESHVLYRGILLLYGQSAYQSTLVNIAPYLSDHLLVRPMVLPDLDRDLYI